MQKRAERLKQCRDAWSGLMEATVRVRPSRDIVRLARAGKYARAPVRNGQMMDGRETRWMGVRCGAGKRGDGWGGVRMEGERGGAFA